MLTGQVNTCICGTHGYMKSNSTHLDLKIQFSINSLYFTASYRKWFIHVESWTAVFLFVSHVTFVLLSGAAVDSTVSEPEQQGHPTPTPAHTLRLLHLSGQGTLAQESLSQ